MPKVVFRAQNAHQNTEIGDKHGTPKKSVELHENPFGTSDAKIDGGKHNTVENLLLLYENKRIFNQSLASSQQSRMD